MPYGYTGQNQPNQTVVNAGVFSISDVYDLEKQGKWGGSLELIQSQSLSGSATCNFTNIKETKYDIHYMVLNDVETASNFYSEIRLSNDGGSTFESSGYTRAVQYGGTQGSFGINRDNGTDRFSILNFSNANDAQSLYIYLYNLGDSSKFSMITHVGPPSNIYMYVGGGVYGPAETNDAIQVLNSAGANFTGGTATLYGVKNK